MENGELCLERKKSPANTLANVVVFVSIVFFVLVVFYELARYRATHLEQHREHQLRKQFTQITDIDKFYFVTEQLKHSRQIVDEGVFASAFVKWLEDSQIYRIVTLDSLALKICFFVLLGFTIMVSLYLFYQYKANQYWFDRATEIKMQGAGRLEQIITSALNAKNSG